MKNIIYISIIALLMLFVGSFTRAENVKGFNKIKTTEILKKADVYPNPAEDYIFLKIEELDDNSDIEIEVMSIIGNKMKISHEQVESGLYKIDLSNIPVGHYYVMLTIDTEKSLKKFLKK